MSKDICKIFGKNLQKYRLQKHLSQEELGFAIDADKSTICNYEKCRRCINLQNAQKIADTLGVKLSEMIEFL